MIAPIATYIPAAKNNDTGISIKSKSAVHGANDEILLIYHAANAQARSPYLKEVATNPDYNNRFGRSLEEPGGKPATVIPSAEEGRKSATKNHTQDPTDIYKKPAIDSDTAQQRTDFYKPYKQPYQPGYAADEKDEKMAGPPIYDKVKTAAAAVENNAIVIYGSPAKANKNKTAKTETITQTQSSRYRLRVQKYDWSPKRYENGSGVSYATSSLERRLRRHRSATNTGSIDDVFDKAA